MMKNIVNLFFNLKFRFRVFCGKHSFLFFMFFYPRHKRLIANRKSELVIEGYPRSGNTFCVVAFSEAQNRKVHIAHHTHAPLQVKLAAYHKVPVIVLVRNPIDLFKSFLIMYPRLTLSTIAHGYNEFYNFVLKKNYICTIVPFNSLVSDFGKVIDKVNEKNNREFHSVVQNKKHENDVFKKIESIKRLKGTAYETMVSIPNAGREKLKKNLEIDLDNKYVKRSVEIYNKMLNKSEL